MWFILNLKITLTEWSLIITKKMSGDYMLIFQTKAISRTTFVFLWLLDIWFNSYYGPRSAYLWMHAHICYR